jgi:hypothetical protein
MLPKLHPGFGLWAGALLLFGGCAFSSEVERRQVRIEELETRVSDLETRLEREAGEKRQLQGELQREREEAGTQRDGWAGDRVRLEDLRSRLKACEDRSAGLSADLDLSRRTGAASEEDRLAFRSQLDAAKALQESERGKYRQEIEACRTRVADLEAQAVLLAAARDREELEKCEAIDEITLTYKALLEGTKSEADECRARFTEAEAEIAKLTAERDEAAEPGRRRCRELERLHREVAEALGKSAAVERLPDRVRIILPHEALFLAGSGVLKAEGTARLFHLAAVFPGFGGLWVSLYDEEGTVSYGGELARLYGSVKEFSEARIAAVARELRKGAGAAMILAHSASALSRPEPPPQGPGIRIDVIPVEATPCERPAQDSAPPNSPQ